MDWFDPSINSAKNNFTATFFALLHTTLKALLLPSFQPQNIQMFVLKLRTRGSDRQFATNPLPIISELQMKVSKETAAMVAQLGLDPEEMVYLPDGAVVTVGLTMHELDGKMTLLDGGLELVDEMDRKLKRQKVQRAKTFKKPNNNKDF